MRVLGVVLLASALGLACGSGREPGSAAERAEAVGSDTAALREVQDAVNEVLRAGVDCEIVKPAADAAQRKIDAARDRVKTPTGAATLDSLQAQVRNIAQNCP